jgi:hypothetical protein
LPRAEAASAAAGPRHHAVIIGESVLSRSRDNARSRPWFRAAGTRWNPEGTRTLSRATRRPLQDHDMSLIISLLITFLVIILVLYLVNLLPIDGRAKQIARIIVIIIGVLALLKFIVPLPL